MVLVFLFALVVSGILMAVSTFFWFWLAGVFVPEITMHGAFLISFFSIITSLNFERIRERSDPAPVRMAILSVWVWFVVGVVLTLNGVWAR